ncbi:2,3-diaminopropionate biosynthesis protein SbnB [Streptomyces venezuelae]|uniref:2,3-diaminopropionate biosynthesis protein SbnB n=1 Tax=Streptomyces venezuelae TaxID=54571 RepID=A0A5P2DSD6_STRVZ|nr:2,3-diaminopropionate biosynthesis protein SbnB [Streptomyces venezuelae]QES57470.1 2,3-diaminopropionate biosynthesis protein SbnB [Streptomyces venezuelae]
MFSFDVVPGKVVKDILDTSAAQVVDLVEDAYLRHDAGQTVNPDSYFLRFPEKPDARIIALPASIELAEDHAVGIKWISSFPGNVADGIPRASAALILNDYATGYPKALLEAATVSAVRTAASAAVAARAFARWVTPDGRVSFIGAGVIARTILRYLVATGYPLESVEVFDLHAESAQNLARFATEELGLQAKPIGSLSEALTAQTVITTTTAGTPYIGQLLRPGQLALNISLRDFQPEVILAASNYFDDVEHCMKANTSPHLAEQVSGGRDFVSGTLADVLRGRTQPQANRGLVFSPFGLGVLDLAVGQYVLDAAREKGLTVEIPDFFGETSRW